MNSRKQYLHHKEKEENIIQRTADISGLQRLLEIKEFCIINNIMYMSIFWLPEPNT